MKYVYDTAELTTRRLTDLTEDFVVPSRVMGEIRKGFLRTKLESLEESISVVDPDEESRESAVRAAKETGDFEKLSETDIDVIAVAVMTGRTVRSDDYAIQNVCTHLEIPVQGSSIPGIRREIIWIWRCTGCRKKFAAFRKKCDICGHELKRFPASQKKL